MEKGEDPQHVVNATRGSKATTEARKLQCSASLFTPSLQDTVQLVTIFIRYHWSTFLHRRSIQLTTSCPSISYHPRHCLQRQTSTPPTSGKRNSKRDNVRPWKGKRRTCLSLFFHLFAPPFFARPSPWSSVGRYLGLLRPWYI